MKAPALSRFPELPRLRPPALAASPSEASDTTFANIYLFRGAHDYRLARAADCLVVLARGYDGEPYAVPPLGAGDRRAALAAAFALLKGEGSAPLLAIATERDLEALGLDEGRYEITEDRDNFDYLYGRRELAELRGNRFHRQKNLINRFAKAHSWESVEFVPGHADCAVRMTEEWYMIRGETRSASARLETGATVEATRLFRELGLQGRAILVDGRVEACALGEMLSAETAVCHFEKTNPRLPGLAQLVNREFAAHAFPAAKFLNREQDLGEPGLRRAKESYRPVGFVKKYRVRPGG